MDLGLWVNFWQTKFSFLIDVVLVYPIFIIPCSSTHVIVRLTSIFVGFIPFYLMVTTNYEVLFIIVYVMVLYTWLLIESKCYGHQTVYRTKFDEEIVPDKTPTSDDFRRAFFFVSFFKNIYWYWLKYLIQTTNVVFFLTKNRLCWSSWAFSAPEMLQV